MAKPPSFNNAVIFLLAMLLGVALPLSAWFLLRTMTIEAVIDRKLQKLDEHFDKLEKERKSNVRQETTEPERARSNH